MKRRTLATLAPLIGVTLLAGCGSSAGSGSDDGRLTVLASFYPLQYVAQQIGGDKVEVSNLTPAAAEPHDLELSPAQLRSIGDAGLVVYLADFQPAVDAAIAERKPKHVVEAGTVAKLEYHPNGGHAEHGHSDETATDDHTDADADGHDHSDAAGKDPHFWLDPERLATVGTAVAKELSAADPESASYYTERAATLAKKLKDLDTEMATGLTPCADATLVTTHQAFGYLAERYDLEEVGISGIDPDAEPSPARLREVADIVREEGVKTLYTERLLNPKATRTLADDVGVRTAVLDPLESQSDPDQDYLDVMRANLAALTGGLVCA